MYQTELSTANYPADNNFAEVANMLRKKEDLIEEFNLPFGGQFRHHTHVNSRALMCVLVRV